MNAEKLWIMQAWQPLCCPVAIEEVNRPRPFKSNLHASSAFLNAILRRPVRFLTQEMHCSPGWKQFEIRTLKNFNICNKLKRASSFLITLQILSYQKSNLCVCLWMLPHYAFRIRTSIERLKISHLLHNEATILYRFRLPPSHMHSKERRDHSKFLWWLLGSIHIALELKIQQTSTEEPFRIKDTLLIVVRIENIPLYSLC